MPKWSALWIRLVGQCEHSRRYGDEHGTICVKCHKLLTQFLRDVAGSSSTSLDTDNALNRPLRKADLCILITDQVLAQRSVAELIWLTEENTT